MINMVGGIVVATIIVVAFLFVGYCFLVGLDKIWRGK